MVTGHLLFPMHNRKIDISDLLYYIMMLDLQLNIYLAMKPTYTNINSGILYHNIHHIVVDDLLQMPRSIWVAKG